MNLKSISSLVITGLALLSLSAANAADTLPLLPQPATSFGATFNGEAVYIYGGNTGKAHEFHKECVKGDFFRLKFPGGTTWEKLPGGQALLSCSLVNYEGKIIRIGGMNARNEKGTKSNLFSTDEVMAFDPANGQWHPWPTLPEPRSSHDSVIVDHTLYVGGGWKLTGDEGDGAHSQWCDTVLKLDLNAPGKGWQTLPQPFQRRAIAAVAHAGRVWFIGGMNSHDEQSRAVDWFEPATGRWGRGPDLPDGPMAGFGVAACEQEGKLCVSPLSGKIFALDAEEHGWTEVGKLAIPRFFHRLLSLSDGRLIAVGGSSRQGQVSQMEIVSLTSVPSSPASTDAVRTR